MAGDHLGIDFIEKYNKDFIRENFEFPFSKKKKTENQY